MKRIRNKIVNLFFSIFLHVSPPLCVLIKQSFEWKTENRSRPVFRTGNSFDWSSLSARGALFEPPTSYFDRVRMSSFQNDGIVCLHRGYWVVMGLTCGWFLVDTLPASYRKSGTVRVSGSLSPDYLHGMFQDRFFGFSKCIFFTMACMSGNYQVRFCKW